MTLRNVIVMAVLALLCVLAWIALSGKEEGDVLPSVWPKFSRGEVVKVVLRGQGETLEIRRRGEHSDTFDVLVGTELVRADSTAVDELLLAIERQQVRERYEHATVGDLDLRGYGLEKPGVEVELTLPGRVERVRYGGRTPGGRNMYVDGGPGTDVWVVAGDAYEQVIAGIQGGMKDRRVFDLKLFDVAELEVVRGGVTAVAVHRDVAEGWRVTQPYKGFAHPTKFDTVVSRIVNAEVEKWVEFGAQDLAKYGLAEPRHEVRLTPRRKGEPVVLLVGKEAEGGGVYVLEEGARNVMLTGKRFLEGVTADPQEYRDRSFTRLGIDGVAIDVNLGETAQYRLEKSGETWDVVKPDRHPADGKEVGRLLAAIRSWHTVEFLDAAKPEDHGIDGKQVVEIEREGGGGQPGGKLTLLFGARADQDTVYAQRKGDGGVERVEAHPYDTLLKGYLPFRRKAVRPDMPIADIERLARERGTEGEGEEVQSIVLTRDVDAKEPTWSTEEGPGVTGRLDAPAVSELLGALQSLTAEEWLFWDPSKNEAMGFAPLKAATLTIEIDFADKGGAPSGGLHQKLLVGRKRPEGGRFARFEGEPWAFVLGEAAVSTLRRDLTK